MTVAHIDGVLGQHEGWQYQAVWFSDEQRRVVRTSAGGREVVRNPLQPTWEVEELWPNVREAIDQGWLDWEPLPHVDNVRSFRRRPA